MSQITRPRDPPAQLRKLAESLERFGFVLPILIDDQRRVVAGWGLVLAARKLGLPEVPAIMVSDLGEADLRLLRLALNRIGEESNWDPDALKLEFGEILQISDEIDLSISGFEMGEIDVVLGDAIAEEDALPAEQANDPPRATPGDLWRLGDHLIFCGDALQDETYQRLLDDERAQMVFTDPPWNIPIEGNVSGLGVAKHRDFAFACGEMTDEQFEGFLHGALGYAARHSADGALSYVCMHWSQMSPMLKAGEAIYDRLVNLCVWSKTNAGMGSLYRSRHELIFLFKTAKAPHINNVSLGRFGRHRSNVWEYPGQSSFNGTAKSKLSLHPTAKPVALVADAIQDASDRGGIVLDPFGGAGSTRLHEDDLAGHVLRKGGWVHLDLPAIAVEEQRIDLGHGRVTVRQIGEALHPARESLEALDAIKREIGSMMFSAQYQQRPVPLEGNLVRRAWFRWFTHSTLPAPTYSTKIIQSWDVAMRTGEANDYSVCATWRVEGNDLYLLDVFRGRLDYPALRRKVIALAQQHVANSVLIEDAGPGMSLLQDLRATSSQGMLRPIGVRPIGDKIDRMAAQTAKIEAGQVHLPEKAPWLPDFLSELLAFPNGRHDDQVDSVSQFLFWWQGSFQFRVPIVAPLVFSRPRARFP